MRPTAVAGGRGAGPSALAAAADIALAAAARPAAASGVVDAGLCHGAAGVAHLFARLHLAPGSAALADAARGWLRRALDLRSPDRGPGGFASWADTSAGGTWCGRHALSGKARPVGAWPGQATVAAKRFYPSAYLSLSHCRRVGDAHQQAFRSEQPCYDLAPGFLLRRYQQPVALRLQLRVGLFDVLDVEFDPGLRHG